MKGFMPRAGWLIPVGLAILAAILVWYTGGFGALQFKPFNAQEIFGDLTALFLIALFLERTLEVFLASWKDKGRLDLEHALARATDAAAAAADADKPAARQAVLAAQISLDKYKADTARAALICGLTAGIIIAIAGARALGPLLTLQPDPKSAQYTLFTIVDVLITGGLIGGGSDGIHKLVSVITDFLDATRDKVAGK